MGETRFEDKRWSVDLEHKILDELEKTSSKPNFSFNPSSDREIFVIDTPPPYPSGTWHIGAVAQYSMIDVIARSQRLLGKEVYFPWGVDRNGINIEFTVERKHNRKMRTFDRAEFIEECRQTIDEYTDAMRKTARRVGLSCDFESQYLTDSPEYRSVTQSIFVDLLLKGDIVEDLRPNLYDPVEGTTIADAEVTRVSRSTRLIHVEWLTEEDETVIISTTRPELICACGVVLVHPEDNRYTHLVGKRIHLPMPVDDRSEFVEIKAHPSVKMDFGSGVLMVCSYGDQNDVSVFRELGLNPYPAIDLDGNMTSVSGPLSGLSVIDARNEAINILEQDGRINSIDERDQEIPVSERGGNPIEIILLKEWYVKQVDIQNRLEQLVNEVRFVPERNKQLLLDWMHSVSIDWPISRRRWYHTEIPLWYSEDGETIVVPPRGSYVRPWCESPPPGSVAINRMTRAEIGKLEDLELGELIGESKVFDTWMDSSNSNLFVSGYGGDESNFNRSFPTALRPQGKEIVRTWLYYTMLKSAHLLDSPAFQTVWIDGLGMDPWGRKMSKSWGNGIDADSVLDCGLGGRTGSWQIRGPDGKSVKLKANKIGSECFRLWKAAEAQVGDDFHINPEEIESKYFGVLTKIFNVARFASQFKYPESRPTTISNADSWILSEYDRMRKNSKKHWSEIDIYSATQAVKTFLTGVFPSHWMEMAKSRLYDEDPSASWTLHTILSGSLSILSPVCPLFCHHLSSVLYGNSTMYENEYPSTPGVSVDNSNIVTKAMIHFNGEIWRTKKERNLSLKSPLEGVSVPDELADYAVDLQRMHSLI